MNRFRTSASALSVAFVACGVFACSGARSAGGAGGGEESESLSSVSGSEVAVSTVSGALSNGSKSTVAFNLRAPKASAVDRALAFMNPVGTAYAADWSCTGEALSPAFRGPGSYSFTPPSCSVTWGGGKTGTSAWSDSFTLVYGSSCGALNPFVEKQPAGCDITRTSGADGDTRTITGPEGNTYAIDHDTNGAGTGWDTSVVPAPTDDGVEVSCGAGGCDASRTLLIHGSHLTGTVDIDGVTARIWDHTVTSDGSGLTVTGAGSSRSVSGSVTVQHNLLKYTSTTVFDGVSYDTPGCCFPTAGSVSTTYSKGADLGRTETLAFSSACGEATLTDAKGVTAPLTLIHCL